MKINGVHPLYTCFAGNRGENVLRLIAKVIEPGGYKDQGLVSVGYHPDHPNLAIFNYTDQVTYTKAWDWVTRVCRGLIVDLVSKTVVALPFPKFFNASESLAPRIRMESPFDVRLKMDGSFGVCFYYANQWHVATRGSFVSEQAKHATAQLRSQRSTLNTEKMRRDITYLTEIIYPENRVVVGYVDTDALCLLGGFNRETGEEYDLNDLAMSVDATWVPPSYSFDFLDAAMTWAKSLPGTMEGIVLRYTDTNERVKIKGDEYCRIHKMVSRITPLGVYDVIVAGGDLEEVRRGIPEEFIQEFDRIHSLIISQIDASIEQTKLLAAQLSGLSDKELGILYSSGKIKESYPDLCDVAGYLFSFRKKGAAAVRQQIIKAIRPTNNILDGFSGTKIAMNKRNSAND